MDQKDAASTVLSSLSLLVSVLTACLSFFSWWQQRKQKAKEDAEKVEQHVAAVKDSYRLADVAFSVREVADVLQHHTGSEQVLWSALQGKEGAIATAWGTITRRELLQHMSKVDGYWDYVIEQYNRDKLPGFFHPDGGWLARADNYRRLFEPLFIANYYSFGKTPYLAPAGSGGDSQPPLKRPERYWRIEQLWAQMEPGKAQYDSTVWAQAYEEQERGRQVPVNMQGISPVRLKQQKVVVVA